MAAWRFACGAVARGSRVVAREMRLSWSGASSALGGTGEGPGVPKRQVRRPSEELECRKPGRWDCQKKTGAPQMRGRRDVGVATASASRRPAVACGHSPWLARHRTRGAVALRGCALVAACHERWARRQASHLYHGCSWPGGFRGRFDCRARARLQETNGCSGDVWGSRAFHVERDTMPVRVLKRR